MATSSSMKFGNQGMTHNKSLSSNLIPSSFSMTGGMGTANNTSHRSMNMPTEDPGTDYVLYHRDDSDGKNMISLIKKFGLTPRTTLQDVAPIEQNPEKYPWFARRKIHFTPAIYECKNGKVHSGQEALSFIENLAKDFSKLQASNNSINQRLVQDHSNKHPAFIEVNTKLDELMKRISERDIEDSVWKTMVLSLLNKILSSNKNSNSMSNPTSGNNTTFQSATSYTSRPNAPREINLKSSKLSGIDSRSPPSSPTSLSPNNNVKPKVVYGPGKMMAPLATIPNRGEGFVPPSASLNTSQIEEERKADIAVWQRAVDGDDTPILLVDEPRRPPLSGGGGGGFIRDPYRHSIS